MTTDAERECYYRLAKQGAEKGEVIEFGAWLGASSAYIAAAMRDSGTGKRAHTYDKFLSKPGHAAKVNAFYAKHAIETMPQGPSFEQFKQNLGPLLDYLIVHKGEIGNAVWGHDPIGCIVFDAPKRIPTISAVLTNFGNGIRAGTILAWQDFCHFPSYEIPACLYRLRDYIEFQEAVVPGTTMVFRVTKPWPVRQVSTEALALEMWSPQEIDEAWTFWSRFVAPEKQALFQCGAAMFFCDQKMPAVARQRLRDVMAAPDVRKKWTYLHERRPDFVTRYAPLFELMVEAA
jgi:hypothetical protein